MKTFEQTLLDGESTIFDKPEFETAVASAIRAFKKQYPSVTLPDHQTFVIAFRIGYGYGYIQGKDEKNINQYPPFELMDERWVESFFPEFDDNHVNDMILELESKAF